MAILDELKRPFHPSAVTWKPGVVAKSGTKALALAYADLRAYQNRLDEVCGMDWSVSYTPWGDKIICNLTISGVTRSSTGEPDAQSERSEIAGTATEAQAFKRACAMFGLGRYLYALPSIWAEYDSERKQFTDAAKSRLAAILTQHYRQYMESQATGGDPVLDLGEMAEGAAESNDGDKPTDAMHRQFHALGTELYGDTWPQVRHRNIGRLTGGQTHSSADLTREQLQKLIDGLNKLKAQRAAA